MNLKLYINQYTKEQFLKKKKKQNKTKEPKNLLARRLSNLDMTSLRKSWCGAVPCITILNLVS